MIKHQREAYNWQFLFLAANQDAIATAAAMGIDRDFAANVQFSHGGLRSSSRSFSRKMQAIRHHAATGEKLPDLTAPMQDIVSEEEDKDDEAK